MALQQQFPEGTKSQSCRLLSQTGSGARLNVEVLYTSQKVRDHTNGFPAPIQFIGVENAARHALAFIACCLAHKINRGDFNDCIHRKTYRARRQLHCLHSGVSFHHSDFVSSKMVIWSQTFKN